MIEINVPKVDVAFKVETKAINRSIFQIRRRDPRQEEIRKLILEAFLQVDKYPERYARTFETFFPEKHWDYKSVEEIGKMATQYGDGLANWVHQRLEWAQVLQKKDNWKVFMNQPDNAEDYRLVSWKDDCLVAIGGSRRHAREVPGVEVFPKIRISAIDEAYAKRLVPLAVKYLD